MHVIAKRTWQADRKEEMGFNNSCIKVENMWYLEDVGV